MDPFDPVRSKATAVLHEELLSEGKDPFDPLALVQAAVGRRDLELVWLPQGDPALKGARALYDDQGGTICCEEEGDPVTRALLVAHELGHSELHAGSATCAGSDIDPSRSTEAAPVGLQRVEDYGARERRELQANVYARELLLPRAFARDLHLKNNLTAAVIADRTKLPVALVRQQLFDALLLPATVIEEESTPEIPSCTQARSVPRSRCGAPRHAVSVAGRARDRQDANLGRTRALTAGRRHRSASYSYSDVLQSCRRRVVGATDGGCARGGTETLAWDLSRLWSRSRAALLRQARARAESRAV